MPQVIPFIPLITGLAGAGATIYGASQAAKANTGMMQTAPLPVTPTPQDAEEKAKLQAKNRRLSLLSSGGNTNVTRGQAYVGSDNVGTKNLLGQ